MIHMANVLSGTKDYANAVKRQNMTIGVQLGVLREQFDEFRRKIFGSPVSGALFTSIRKTITKITSLFTDKDTKDKMTSLAVGIGNFLQTMWSFVDRAVEFGLSNFKKFLRISSGVSGTFLDTVISPAITFMSILFEKARIKVMNLFSAISGWVTGPGGKSARAGLASLWGFMKPMLQWSVENPEKVAIIIFALSFTSAVTKLAAAFTMLKTAVGSAGVARVLASLGPVGVPLAAGVYLAAAGPSETEEALIAEGKAQGVRFSRRFGTFPAGTNLSPTPALDSIQQQLDRNLIVRPPQPVIPPSVNVSVYIDSSEIAKRIEINRNRENFRVGAIPNVD